MYLYQFEKNHVSCHFDIIQKNVSAINPHNFIYFRHNAKLINSSNKFQVNRSNKIYSYEKIETLIFLK